MEYRNIIVEKKEGIARIALNRPEVLNAMNTSTLKELNQALDGIEKDESIKVVILTGAGRAFSAGMDLKAVASEGAEMFEAAVETFNRVANFPLPVICAVKGYVITGGMELALACDMLIAAEDTRFRDTHLRVGILPAAGNSQRLPRIVGEKRAKEILFASPFIPAKEAERLGLVNRVVPLARLDEEAWSLAKTIAEIPRHLLVSLKRVVNEGMAMDFAAATRYERLEGMRIIKASAGEAMSQTGKSVIVRGSTEVKNG